MAAGKTNLGRRIVTASALSLSVTLGLGATGAGGVGHAHAASPSTRTALRCYAGPHGFRYCVTGTTPALHVTSGKLGDQMSQGCDSHKWTGTTPANHHWTGGDGSN